MKLKHLRIICLAWILVLSAACTTVSTPETVESTLVPSASSHITALSSTSTLLPTITVTKKPPLLNTPALILTTTATPPIGQLPIVSQYSGWTTYRNEIVGYEISIPSDYQIQGIITTSDSLNDNRLGPRVPREEIDALLAKYYGDRLQVTIHEGGSFGEYHPTLLIKVFAYDIIVNMLNGTYSPGGMGDYDLTHRNETFLIDGQTYAIKITEMRKNNTVVGEIGNLYLENGGVEITFGYNPHCCPENPEDYQNYLQNTWPIVRKIIESYRPIPQK